MHGPGGGQRQARIAPTHVEGHGEVMGGPTKANEDLISGVAFYKFSESKGYNLNAPDMNVLKGMNDFFHRHEEFYS